MPNNTHIHTNAFVHVAIFYKELMCYSQFTIIIYLLLVVVAILCVLCRFPGIASGVCKCWHTWESVCVWTIFALCRSFEMMQILSINNLYMQCLVLESSRKRICGFDIYIHAHTRLFTNFVIHASFIVSSIESICWLTECCPALLLSGFNGKAHKTKFR